MSTIKDIYSFLDGLYPRTLSCEWDNDGLMVCRNSEREVKKVLLALDVTRKVADEAISGGYDLIISHHPLIFRPLKQLSEEYAGALIPMKLFSAGVSVISLHTRFDAGEGGINDTLAALLGIDVISPFGPDGEKCGRLCTTSETTAHGLCNKIKETLGAPCVLCGNPEKEIRTVALLGGDGKSFISEALKVGADAFVTGASGYNAALEAADRELAVIDAGHYHTEFLPLVQRMTSLISSAFADVSVAVSGAGCEISCF